MRIATGVFALLFGGLHLIAGLTQSRSRDPAVRGFAIAMACGGIALVCAAVVHLTGQLHGWQDAISAATGCLLICAAAYANGRRSGSFHLSHHLIRGGIALLLTIAIAVW